MLLQQEIWALALIRSLPGHNQALTAAFPVNDLQKNKGNKALKTGLEVQRLVSSVLVSPEVSQCGCFLGSARCPSSLGPSSSPETHCQQLGTAVC